MSRRRRQAKFKLREQLVLLFFCLLGLIGLLNAPPSRALPAWTLMATFGSIFIVVIASIFFLDRLRRLRILKQKRAYSLIEHVDHMSGVEFEGYIEAVLHARGYHIKTTPKSGDLGVDLIARKDGTSYAIQVKRYSHPVDRRAVSDAVAGMKHYKCDKAMVITNNYFRPGAKQLAASNNCTLVDRDMLASWVAAFQQR